MSQHCQPVLLIRKCVIVCVQICSTLCSDQMFITTVRLILYLKLPVMHFDLSLLTVQAVEYMYVQLCV